MNTAEHNRQVYAYYQKCIERGWGFNSAALDVEGDKQVLNDKQVGVLRKKESERHPGWQPPLVAEVKPFEKIPDWNKVA